MVLKSRHIMNALRLVLTTAKMMLYGINITTSLTVQM